MMVWITCLWDSVEAKSEVLKTNIKWWFCITLIKKESLFYNTCCILRENFSVNMKPIFSSLSQHFFLYSTFFLSLFFITGCFLLDLILFHAPLCLNPVMLLNVWVKIFAVANNNIFVLIICVEWRRGWYWVVNTISINIAFVIMETN